MLTMHSGVGVIWKMHTGTLVMNTMLNSFMTKHLSGFSQ